MTKQYLPILALIAACGGHYNEQLSPANDNAFDDEDAGEVGLVSQELTATCNVEAMHKASRQFFMSRVPSGTVCAGKPTDQYWTCKGSAGRTWSVFAYDMTYTQVYRRATASQSKSFDWVCDYSARCQLSCRLILSR